MKRLSAAIAALLSVLVPLCPAALIIDHDRYRARFVVISVDGLWKITDLELLQQERLPS